MLAVELLAHLRNHVRVSQIGVQRRGRLSPPQRKPRSRIAPPQVRRVKHGEEIRN